MIQTDYCPDKFGTYLSHPESQGGSIDPFFDRFPRSNTPKIYRISEEELSEHLKESIPLKCDGNYDAKLELRESDSRHRQRGREKALVFSYHTGEEALSAAIRSVRAGRDLFFSRTVQDDGTDCFSVMDGEGKVIEKHTVLKLLK